MTIGSSQTKVKVNNMAKFKAIYLRVSTSRQNHDSQEPDLKSWAEGKQHVQWFYDKQSGKSMDRPGWNKVMELVRLGKFSDIVVWRLDRLGRKTSGVCALFEELTEAKVNLISLRDGVNLNTPAGRMVANVLASIAQFERELTVERIHAGIDAAKAKGKTWGGSKKGVRRMVKKSHVEAVTKLKGEGLPIVQISEALGLSRKTIYSILREGA